MPMYIVCHGSLRKDGVNIPVDGEVELTKEQADHINSSGQMVRLPGVGFSKTPVRQMIRNGLEGERLVQLGGDVVSSEADGEPDEEAEPEAEAPKKPKKPKGGGK